MIIARFAHGSLNSIGRAISHEKKRTSCYDFRACLAWYGDPDDPVGTEALMKWLIDLNSALKIPTLGQCCGVQREVFERVVEKLAEDALASGSPSHNH